MCTEILIFVDALQYEIYENFLLFYTVVRLNQGIPQRIIMRTYAWLHVWVTAAIRLTTYTPPPHTHALGTLTSTIHVVHVQISTWNELQT